MVEVIMYGNARDSSKAVNAFVDCWRGIETAPLCQPILGWCEGGTYVCWSIGKGHAWAFFDDPEVGQFSFHPTHWMPLPKSPR